MQILIYMLAGDRVLAFIQCLGDLLYNLRLRPMSTMSIIFKGYRKRVESVPYVRV